MSKKNGAARAEVPRLSVTKRPRQKPLGVRIDADLVDEARAAAAVLGGLPHQMTLAKIVTEALIPHLEKMRREHNRGRPFSPLAGRLRTGPRLKISSS